MKWLVEYKHEDKTFRTEPYDTIETARSHRNDIAGYSYIWSVCIIPIHEDGSEGKRGQ